MIALLGPPPKDFLERGKTDRPWLWFDEDGMYLIQSTGAIAEYLLPKGNWKGATEIPKLTLEDAEKQLQGEEKALFLQFIRKMLKWKPEERESARKLLEDPWLNTDGDRVV